MVVKLKIYILATNIIFIICAKMFNMIVFWGLFIANTIIVSANGVSNCCRSYSRSKYPICLQAETYCTILACLNKIYYIDYFKAKCLVETIN